MPCSPAKLEANRRNAAKSTGPRSDEGKERSRANALKHGMTGEGVVVPPEDEGEVATRAEQLEREMRPSGLLGRILVRRVAALSVRLDRCVRHEGAMVARRKRHAARAYEEERLAVVLALADGLATDPVASLRGLRETPEGVDWLLDAWREVKEDLACPAAGAWNKNHLARVGQLMGVAAERFERSPIAALCRACWGYVDGLAPDQGAGLGAPERKAWARAQLGELIDGQIEALVASRPGGEAEEDARDRAEAGDRALFDPSKEACLARRYEAAAERGLFRTLREFRQVEAEAAARAATGADAGGPEEPKAAPEPGEEPAPAPTAPARPSGRLGSFFPSHMPEVPPVAARSMVAAGGWGSGGAGLG